MKKFLLFLFCAVFLLFPKNSFANPIKIAFGKGMQAYMQGRHAQAVNHFNEAIRLYPGFAQAYNFLALSQKELNINPEIIANNFKKAIELKPDYAEAYNNLGKLYYEHAKYDESLEYCAKAIELNPDFYVAELTVGWTYLIGKNNPKKAIDHFEHVVAKTDIAYAYLGLGISYFLTDQNYRVLDIISTLTDMGETQFADQLQEMMQSGDYMKAKVAVKARAYEEAKERQKNNITSDNKPAYNYDQYKNMEVNVQSTQSQSAVIGDNSNAAETGGLQRIQQLQRNMQRKDVRY